MTATDDTRPEPDPASSGATPSAGIPVTEERPRTGLGLGARFFLAAVGLLAVTLGAALGGAGWKARAAADRKILEDLKSVPRVFEGHRDSQGAARRAQVRSLAEEPGTKALLAEANAETAHDTAAEFARGLGAGAVLLFDARGTLLARGDRPLQESAGRDFSQVSWVQTPLQRLADTTAYIVEVRDTRTLSMVASAPVVQGDGDERRLIGVLAGTFPVTDALATELAQLTSGEVAFFANVAPRNAPPSPATVAASAALADPGLPARLAALFPELVPALLVGGKPFGPIEFELLGETHVGTLLPLKSGGGEPIAALLVARSKEAEMAVFRQTRSGLLLAGGIVLLLALPASYALAHFLARPIRLLAAGAEQVGQGRLDIEVPEAGGGEVGALTHAFSLMLRELREKAQLEALVADMQRRPGDITYGGGSPTATPGSAEGLEIGNVFARRYEILSRLGEGGMGAVFRARDRELDEEVALKVLKPQAEDDGAQAERLRQETKLARQITHPNVVRAHDFGEADGARFLTMEYVPGTTLRELLSERGALDVTPALQIAKQICRGLTAVHKAGIVHGDLKPHNVMVMGSGVAKLMDFGVARARAQQATAGVMVAGTPLYMSPEQARGAEIDERSDLYSAGVVMFEMVTGRCPFAGGSITEILDMHLNDAPPNPRHLQPAVPEALAAIILKCLAKSKLARPTSAAELDRMLMRVRV